MKRLSLLFLLVCSMNTLFAQKGPFVGFRAGYASAEAIIHGFHGGAEFGWMFTPYIGASVRFDGVANMTPQYTVAYGSYNENAYDKTQWGVIRGVNDNRDYASARVYSVGVVFNPIAIKYPETRHIFSIRADVGFSVGSVLDIYEGSTRVDRVQAQFRSGLAYAGELSYGYKIVGPLAVGAYARIENMPIFSICGGLLVGLYF